MARSTLQARIIGDIFTNGSAFESMKVLCDEIGGRASGLRSGDLAQDFAEECFLRWNLDNVHCESFRIRSWERGPIDVAVSEPYERRITALALGNSCSTGPLGIDAEVVDVGYGHPDEFRGLGRRLRGKLALMSDGSPEGKRAVHRSEKMELCIRYGAVGMVFMSKFQGGIPVTGTCRHGVPSPIPGVGISKEDGEWMRRIIRGGRRVRMRIRMSNSMGDSRAANVIGEISGSEVPGEVIVACAHLDSWDVGSGAIDNASGSAVLLESARVLRKLAGRMRRTIRFILFMGEEIGLCGSRAYVEDHRDELDDIAMLLNLDIVGSPQKYVIHGHSEARPILTKFASELRGLGISGGVSERPTLHSDHQPFMLEGVPTMAISTRFENDVSRYVHTWADTPDKVPEKYLNDSSAVVALTLYRLASSKKRPARRYSPDETADMLIRHNLKDALVGEKEWKFER